MLPELFYGRVRLDSICKLIIISLIDIDIDIDVGSP